MYAVVKVVLDYDFIESVECVKAFTTEEEAKSYKNELLNEISRKYKYKIEFTQKSDNFYIIEIK